MSSPGVITREFDLTLNANSAVNRAAAMFGVFRWGPVDELVTVSTNESEVVRLFGAPDTNTTISFHTAVNYLLYSSPLIICRVADRSVAKNAYPTGETAATVLNFDDYQSKESANTGISFIGRYPGALGNALEISCADDDGYSGWDYEDLFDFAPEAGFFHAVVVDATGAISGTSGTVLETYDSVSKTAGTKRDDGTSAYIKDVIEASSNWVWLFDVSAIDFTDTGSLGVYEIALQGGVDANSSGIDTDIALEKLANAETVDFVAAFTSITAAATNAALVDLCETRGDSVAFVAPDLVDIYNVSESTALTNIKTYYNSELNKNSSYGFGVDNHKMVYDKYSNKMIWIPCSGDAAACFARLDELFYSPAGTDRGQLKNVVKLAWNPSKATRDELYRNSINSIIALSGQGVVLFGDKTLLKRNSAFKQINVRGLLIEMKKNITAIGRDQLFKLNDVITRSIFRGATDRYMDNVQGRGGVTDKLVICDESNNTAQVIDANEFVGTIYFKPSRSINTVKLGFVSVASGIDFSEVEGQGFGF